MRSLVPVFALALVVACSSTVVRPPVSAPVQAVVGRTTGSIRVSASPIANLSWHVQCLSEDSPLGCTHEAYRELWKKLGSDPLDASMLRRWRELLEKHSGELGESPRLAYPFAELVEYRQERIRALFLGAADLASAESAVGTLIGAADASAMVSVLRHFEPRFQKFWEGEGARLATPYAAELALALQEPFVADLLARIKVFFGLDPQEQTVFWMHAIVRPGERNGHTAAEQIGPHLPFELAPGESPRERAGVLVHEMVHYYFSRMAASRLNATIAGVEKRLGPDTAVALGLMNEALATSVGNAIAGAYFEPAKFPACLSKPRCLYSDEAIHIFGAALGPAVSDAFRSGHTVDSERFVTGFADSSRSLQGVRRAHLLPFRIFISLRKEDEFRPAERAFRQAARAGSVYRFKSPDASYLEATRQYPGASVLLMASPAELASLGALGIPLRKVPTEPTVCRFVQGSRTVWLMVAKDSQAMLGLAKKVLEESPPPCDAER